MPQSFRIKHFNDIRRAPTPSAFHPTSTDWIICGYNELWTDAVVTAAICVYFKYTSYNWIWSEEMDFDFVQQLVFEERMSNELI